MPLDKSVFFIWSPVINSAGEGFILNISHHHMAPSSQWQNLIQKRVLCSIGKAGNATASTHCIRSQMGQQPVLCKTGQAELTRTDFKTKNSLLDWGAAQDCKHNASSFWLDQGNPRSKWTPSIDKLYVVYSLMNKGKFLPNIQWWGKAGEKITLSSGKEWRIISLAFFCFISLPPTVFKLGEAKCSWRSLGTLFFL